MRDDEIQVSVERVTVNRKLSCTAVSLFGLAAGILSYLFAEALVPRQVSNAGDHDVYLAVRLGFIFTPIVGIWNGWIQRSWQRALIGAAIGIILGVVYMFLCESRNFFAIQVSFPCLLGAVLAATVSSNRSPWFADLATRFGKGLLAGLALGIVYMLTLSIVADVLLSGQHFNDEDYTRRHVWMMWRAGPIALGIASSLFFPLFRWAVRLNLSDVNLRPNASDIEVPKVISIPSNTTLEQVGVIPLVDHMLTQLIESAPAELLAESTGNSGVTWLIKTGGKITEVFHSSDIGEFRSVLARFAHAYLEGQLYGGYTQRKLTQGEKAIMARMFMANGNGAGHWIRVYAL